VVLFYYWSWSVTLWNPPVYYRLLLCFGHLSDKNFRFDLVVQFLGCVHGANVPLIAFYSPQRQRFANQLLGVSRPCPASPAPSVPQLLVTCLSIWRRSSEHCCRKHSPHQEEQMPIAVGCELKREEPGHYVGTAPGTICSRNAGWGYIDNSSLTGVIWASASNAAFV
jgi:hypothetical protein